MKQCSLKDNSISRNYLNDISPRDIIHWTLEQLVERERRKETIDLSLNTGRRGVTRDKSGIMGDAPFLRSSIWGTSAR